VEAILVNIHELLTRREDLGNLHRIRHKLIADILELVIAKGMARRYGEMPSASLNGYKHILALIGKEARGIYAVLILAVILHE
jgi:hypothetical protein